MTEPMLDRAVRLLQDHYRFGHCAFIDRRRDGETCRQHMTAMQGRPHPGCGWCETGDFLKEIGRVPGDG